MSRSLRTSVGQVLLSQIFKIAGEGFGRVTTITSDEASVDIDARKGLGVSARMHLWTNCAKPKK